MVRYKMSWNFGKTLLHKWVFNFKIIFYEREHDMWDASYLVHTADQGMHFVDDKFYRHLRSLMGMGRKQLRFENQYTEHRCKEKRKINFSSYTFIPK